MRIVIPGGTGQVGTMLARAFHADGHEVVVFGPHPTPAPWRVATWDARTLGPWTAELEGADVVIGLAGRSVNCRYTPANRRSILESRVESARIVGEALARCAMPPAAWLQMSTATIYSHRFDAPNDETTGVIGGHEPDAPAKWKFSIEVLGAWALRTEPELVLKSRRVVPRRLLQSGFRFEFPVWDSAATDLVRR